MVLLLNVLIAALASVFPVRVLAWLAACGAVEGGMR